MSNAPLRPCLAPRCPSLVTSGRCPKHQTANEPGRWPDKPPVKRITGRRLQALRKALYLRMLTESEGNPTCVLCGQFLAFGDMERDHPINLAEGGKDDETNEAGVHKHCHKAKTHHESMRGRQ